MPVAARIAGGSSKPARASTREIGKGLHSPFKIHTAACQPRIIAARTPVTNPQASAVTFRKVAANAVLASTCAASRAEKNTIPPSIGPKLAPALALTLKNKGIPRRSRCALLRLVLGFAVLGFAHAGRIAGTLFMGTIHLGPCGGNRIPRTDVDFFLVRLDWIAIDTPPTVCSTLQRCVSRGRSKTLAPWFP